MTIPNILAHPEPEYKMRAAKNGLPRKDCAPSLDFPEKEWYTIVDLKKGKDGKEYPFFPMQRAGGRCKSVRGWGEGRPGAAGKPAVFRVKDNEALFVRIRWYRAICAL